MKATGRIPTPPTCVLSQKKTDQIIFNMDIAGPSVVAMWCLEAQPAVAVLLWKTAIHHLIFWEVSMETGCCSWKEIGFIATDGSFFGGIPTYTYQDLHRIDACSIFYPHACSWMIPLVFVPCDLPSGQLTLAIEKSPFIVDLPIEVMIFHDSVSLSMSHFIILQRILIINID